MIEDQFGYFSANHYEYRFASLGLWQSGDEVHADRIPTPIWNRIGCIIPCFFWLEVLYQMHVLDVRTYVFMSSSMLSHQNRILTALAVRSMPGCATVGAS
ncbi:hypothetical protein Plhal703r1_c32g0123231 [Plasmopara halstedii]